MAARAARSKQKIRTKDLESMSDEELLSLRFCDLPIRLADTEVMGRVERVYEELASRGISFRPHVWLSTEWFSPDGVPGFAIPFYLAHPRLARLEQKMMLEVEGANERECMKILRHETGHAIDNAYRLHYRRSWQRLFGKFSKSYPKFYRPRPDSRRFVLHLNNWYAQAHPAEDFAETFAVWLTPNSRWKQQYADWPALKKITYVDETMADIAGVKPPVRSSRFVDSVRTVKKTLDQHYRERQDHYGEVRVDFYSEYLERLFSDDPEFEDRHTAASMIRGMRRELRSNVAFFTGTYQYTVDQVLEEMTERCKELNLRLMFSELDTRRHLATLVTAITMNLVHSGRNIVAL